MAKIMLVEDDHNLRSIYGDRLLAEGYEIVSASDGEEALALAVKEKPDLIISDVMMPKISGFDMLDILRSTPETKNTKVIMMTALSQAEDKDRADKLGADRYLVKSQVTLDDVARTVNEVLNDSGLPGAAASASAQPVAPVAMAVATEPTPATTPAPVAAEPVALPDTQVTSDNNPQAQVDVTTTPPPPVTTATDEPVAPATSTADEPSANLPVSTTPTEVVDAPTVQTEQADISAQIDKFISSNLPDTPVHQDDQNSSMPDVSVSPASQPTTPQPAATAQPPVAQVDEANQPAQTEVEEVHPPSVGERVIQPLNDPSSKPDIMALYEKEMASEATQNAPATNSSVNEPVTAAPMPAETAPTPNPAPTAPQTVNVPVVEAPVETPAAAQAPAVEQTHQDVPHPDDPAAIAL